MSFSKTFSALVLCCFSLPMAVALAGPPKELSTEAASEALLRKLARSFYQEYVVPTYHESLYQKFHDPSDLYGRRYAALLGPPDYILHQSWVLEYVRHAELVVQELSESSQNNEPHPYHAVDGAKDSAAKRKQMLQYEVGAEILPFLDFVFTQGISNDKLNSKESFSRTLAQFSGIVGTADVFEFFSHPHLAYFYGAGALLFSTIWNANRAYKTRKKQNSTRLHRKLADAISFSEIHQKSRLHEALTALEQKSDLPESLRAKARAVNDLLSSDCNHLLKYSRLPPGQG